MWVRHGYKPARRRGPARLVGALVAAATAATTLVAAAAPAAAGVVEPFAKRYDEALYGDFVTFGNTVMQCPDAPPEDARRCADAQAGNSAENNNQFAMRYTDTARFGQTVLNSSTGQVKIPPGSEVAYARLFWGGNDGTYKLGRNQINYCDTAGKATSPAGDPLKQQPLLKVNGGPESRVTVENAVKTPAETGGPHYYTAEADVTEQFQSMASGVSVPVSVGDVWAPTGKGCVGGWSLTVVYKYDGPNERYAPDRKNVYVYGGHVVQRSADPDTTVSIDGFYRTGSGPLRASVTAYEGDANVAGDQFLVNGTNVANDDGDKRNVFNSHADGCLAPCSNNNFSVDAEAIDIPGDTIREGATSADLTFRTKGDTYVPQALAFSVPVPDLRVTKTASPAKVAPGDKLTFTVKATNISRLPYPNAKFTDDLTDSLDDAVYNGDAKASTGKVSYSEPRVSYLGDIPAGKTATVTYSVTVKDPPSGDGKLQNNVDVASPRSNCEAGSTDPACGTTPEVTDPGPAPAPPPIDISNRPADALLAPCASTTSTITLTNRSGRTRYDADIDFPARAGGAPRASAGKLTKKGDTWFWKGDVPAHGKVTIKQRVRASCTPGESVVITVSCPEPGSTCSAPGDRAGNRAGGGSDPCTSVITTERTQARAVPAKDTVVTDDKPGDRAGGGLAATGADDNRLLLYGGLAVILTGLGALAMAAARGRRD